MRSTAYKMRSVIGEAGSIRAAEHLVYAAAGARRKG